MTMEANVKSAALSLLKNDFSVLPCHPDKRPAVSTWKAYQQTPMTVSEAEKLFVSGTSLAVIGGKVSRNLECMDFDNPSLFAPFLETLTEVAPDLQDKLVIRQTPSGGYHLIYRSQEAIQGNQKLATSGDGKETWIETRGEGGYFLTTPRSLSGN